MKLIHEDFLDWQRPVLTEQKAHELLELDPLNKDITFFSFAWSSFIDKVDFGEPEDSQYIRNKVEAFAHDYCFNNAFTVCQHDKFHHYSHRKK